MKYCTNALLKINEDKNTRRLPRTEVVRFCAKVLQRYGDRIHLCVPIAPTDSIQHLHVLSPRLRVHAPFRLCVVGVLEDVLQRCVPCSQSDAIDVQVPRYTLRWDLPEYYDVEGCRIIEGENARVGGGRDVRVDSREVARNVFPPAAVDKGG